MHKSALITYTQPELEMAEESSILENMNVILQQNKDQTLDNKIAMLLLLLLFVSSACIPSYADVATANVSANIISTLSITTQTTTAGGSQRNQALTGLVFGDIASSTVAGTIVLTPSGARTTTGGPSINSAVTASPAAFDVQGDANATYNITLPVSVVLNGSSSGSMVVDNFTSSPSSTGLLDGTGRQILFVGASLNVGINQIFGSYTGQMAITVAYN